MIEPELDERAANATMSRAQRVYEDGARDISRVMRQQITDGAQSAGRAHDEMADRARRAYLSMQDAAEKVAKEERKLDAAREKGSSNTEAIARRVERARLDEVQAINRARDAYNDYDQAVNRSTRASVVFREGFRTGINNAVSDATSSFGVFGDTATNVFSTLSPKAAGIAGGIVGIGAAALVVGKQLYDLGTTWDDVTDGISSRTGMVGAELAAVTSSVERVASGVAIPLEMVGDIAGQTAQSLHLSGAPLDAMIKQISELTEITGEAVNVRDLGKLYRVFGVEAGAMPKVLDDLYAASTNSGRSVNELVGAALKGAPALSAFGLSIGSSTGLISLLEEAGVDADAAVGAMTIALKKFADAGLAPQQALRDTITQIKSLNDSGNQVGAIDLAQTTFGRGFAPIFEAIRSGTVDAQALTDTLTGSTKPSINDMADSTRDAAEAFKMLKNKVAIEFAPAAKSEFEAINQLLTDMMGTLTSIANGDWGSAFGDIFDGLTDPFTSPNAPWRKWFGDKPPPVPTDPRTGLPGSQSNAPASSRDSGGVPDFSIDPSTGLPRSQSNAPASSRDSGGLPTGMVPPAPGMPGGPPLLLPTEKGSKSLPDAPVLPLQYTNTTGMPSSIANATTSLDEASHEVAEKEARLNQLKQSNVADANDIQKAENDLTKAHQNQLKAEQSLTDARIKATEQANKQLGKLSNDMNEFGNKLDADFGISKGLGGIVENFIKAAGNILAAPFLQALGMVEKANPNEGSGLVGILAANGAFGSQYTPAALAALQQQGTTSSYGVTRGVPGGPAAMAMPGESNRDFAHRAMMPFWQSQGFTVGDHGADKYGEHQNGALDIMVGSIAEGQKVLQQVLSDPNVYGAIFDNKTYGYGHGLTPQDYSAGHTGNPTQDHQDHVHAFYKPGDPNDIKPALSSASNGPVPVTVVSAPGMPQQGLSEQQWNAIAGREASGNWAMNSGNGFSGGLQFTPQTWTGFGGGQYAPQAWQATPQQQMAIGDRVLASQGPGAWPTTSAEHPEWFQPQPYSSGWGPGPQAPPMPGTVPAGGQGVGFGTPGPGIGNAALASAPTMGGGTAYPSQGGNSGNAIGGMALDGIMAATAGLDMLAPGSSAAAKIGIQLANRSIGFAAQAGGIAASGVGEFLTVGDNPRGSIGSSWWGKLAGGLAGAAPALPNLAGGKKPPGPMTQAGGDPAKAGNVDNSQTNHITVTPPKDTSANTQAAMVGEQTRMYSQPGKQ